MTAPSAYTLARPFDDRQTDRGEDWRESAACLTEDPEVFFPHPSDLIGVTEAKAICQRCPVIATCGEAALDRPERDGIWGGMSEGERANILRRRRHYRPGGDA